MKQRFFLLAVVFTAMTAALNAQTISVVAPDNTTTLYTSLDTAIIKAAAGSTIYLSGGGFQIKDETKITKKLTIIGIGHKADNDNADGNTVVSGNFFFENGTSNSAVMGLYLSGNVNIADANVAVNNFLLRYCNVNSVQVGNSNCQGVVINQNYLRNISNCSNSAVSFTNNVLHSIYRMDGGVIKNNVVRHSYEYYDSYPFNYVSNSQISNNILIDPHNIHRGNNCIISNNMLNTDWGDESYGTIKITGDWEDIFEGPITGVNPVCNYHLKSAQGKNAGTDGTDVGIYGGTGFSDAALPPGPRIIRKVIADQTDENGNLRVQIEVKVGE
jgi:hypothetical protein